ncbi:translation initiation factor eif-2B beta subunit, putative [Entamoeba invadens IP1]|uniref:Translation initiation factor eIF2B subunit beta n=1 Tax=Entamoeba invadens IP1 TaxID=370355 RepID=A0A0A1TY84_ENTIV|nr:translation initiation factor eif-2B beta subunit, putative [Entamoeba invadens IP1]ELP84500.1 translation initiation factor eif-2B beta subunit, putative [Entamoeba invadens IP1]|eukprot:XP_004183846.1 translation initiation factor eif-2B beta subunit, putative [Entamoeba invadens IP1]
MQRYQATFDELEEILQRMRRGIIYGAFQSANPILAQIMKLVKKEDFERPSELMSVLQGMGKYLQRGSKIEFSTVNIVRRVMFIVREVERSLSNVEFDVQSNELHRLVSESPSISNVDMKKFKKELIESLKEYQTELKTLYKSIAEQGEAYINDNDVVLLFGKSKTVLEFIAGAKTVRTFYVIVVDSLQRKDGEEIVLELQNRGIKADLFPESALFSVLPHVNKIVLGCHTVLANGGLIAAAGAFNLCCVATHFRVPVYVCTGTFKISPIFPTNDTDFALIQSPLPIMPAVLSKPSIQSTQTGLELLLDRKSDEETADKSSYQIEEAKYTRVINSTFEYISPDWINLFITNENGVPPSYIYRLLAQLYNPEDTFFTTR